VNALVRGPFNILERIACVCLRLSVKDIRDIHRILASNTPLTWLCAQYAMTNPVNPRTDSRTTVSYEYTSKWIGSFVIECIGCDMRELRIAGIIIAAGGYTTTYEKHGGMLHTLDEISRMLPFARDDVNTEGEDFLVIADSLEGKGFYRESVACRFYAKVCEDIREVDGNPGCGGIIPT
jgi:hypothetical protein